MNIYEYGSKIKKEIGEFLKTADVESYELTNEIKRTKENNADFREWAGDKEGWYEFITDAKDIEAINRLKETYFKVINGISRNKREQKLGEEKVILNDEKKIVIIGMKVIIDEKNIGTVN